MAPQQPWPSVTSTSHPFRASTRTTASIAGPCISGMMHPDSMATLARSSPCAGATCPRALNRCFDTVGADISSSARPGASAASTFVFLIAACRPLRWYRRSPIATSSRRRWCGMIEFSTRFPNSLGKNLVFRCRSTSLIVASMRLPYGTPDGHATSHARHWMHRSQWRYTSGVIPIRPSFTAFIRAMRPLGDSVSSPVSR